MSQIRQVKEATDIVELIGQRVELKSAGIHFKGLCPFHSEKSPSFFVSPVIQRYKCFGCAESGDVFSFLEKYEGMTFAEALQTLADQANITLDSYQPSPADDQRQRGLVILEQTAAYYHYLLTEHEVGSAARAYLKSREVHQDSVKLFSLGWSLPGWDGLIKYLHGKKQHALTDLEAVGLIIKGRNGRYYDRFRGRVMFPLTNHRGQVVGFSGRTLDPDAKEAKYINSPETDLYHKSELLFGFSQLYQQIRQANEVVVVEGELDVISSFQAHVPQVVAIKGSALTTEQLKLLQRAAAKVLLSLDMDSAGVTATKRAIELAAPFELELRVVRLPSTSDGAAKDPDQLAREDPKAWRNAVKQAVSVYDFLIEAALDQHDPQTASGRRDIINDLAPVLGHINHAVEQDVYLRKLATALQAKPELVRQDIFRFKDRKKPGQATVLQSAHPDQAAAAKQTKPSREIRLERYGLFLLLNYVDEKTFQPAVSQLKPLVQHAVHQQLIKALEGQAPKALAEDFQQYLMEVAAEPEFTTALDAAESWQSEWRQVLKKLEEQCHKVKISQITQQLAKLDEIESKTPEQEAEQAKLLAEIVGLRSK